MSLLEMYQLFNIVVMGVLGLIIGSFLNVCIYRIPEGRTVVKGHSMCMSCGHNLGAADLVPLFSYLFLRGKCRYCGAPIASRYAKIEGATGLVYTSIAFLHRDTFVLSTEFRLRDYGGLCSLILLLISASVLIVAMMILFDRQQGMIRFSVTLLVLYIFRILLLTFRPANVSYVSFTDRAGSYLYTSVCGGLLAIMILLIFLLLCPHGSGKYMDRLRSFRGVRQYFTKENRGKVAADLLFITVGLFFGYKVLILAAIGYGAFRFLAPSKFRYAGIAMNAFICLGLLGSNLHFF